MTGSTAEPLCRDPAEPRFTLPRGSLCWTRSENREQTRPMGACVGTSTGSAGIRTEGRGCPGQPRGDSAAGACLPRCPPAARGRGQAANRAPAALTMFLALMLRVRQMTSRISCTGTDTGAPNSELKRRRAERSSAQAPQHDPTPPHVSSPMSTAPRAQPPPRCNPFPPALAHT